MFKLVNPFRAFLKASSANNIPSKYMCHHRAHRFHLRIKGRSTNLLLLRNHPIFLLIIESTMFFKLSTAVAAAMLLSGVANAEQGLGRSHRLSPLAKGNH